MQGGVYKCTSKRSLKGWRFCVCLSLDVYVCVCVCVYVCIHLLFLSLDWIKSIVIAQSTGTQAMTCILCI